MIDARGQGLGLAMIVLAALFVGVMPNAAKLSYGAGASPLALLLARSAIGAAGMAAFLALRGHRLGVPRGFVRPTALAGVAMLLAAGGGMGAVAYIDVSLASALFFLYPFFVALAGHLQGTARLGRGDWALMAVAFAGLALALGVDPAGLNLTGVALAVTSALGITIMVLATTETSRAIGTVRANLHMTLWAGLYFLAIAALGPAAGLTGALRFPDTATGWLYMLAAGISFTLGYLFFFVAATILGATRASVLSILEPVMMILFALVLVGEWLTPLQWAGIVLVLGALWTMEIVSARRNAALATVAAVPADRKQGTAPGARDARH